MRVHYRNKQLAKECEDAEVATKKYGNDMAEKIDQRIGELIAANCVDDLIKYRIGRCHSLKGDRKGQYAMDLVHPDRIIFSKLNGNEIAVEILEIGDYH